MDNQSSLTPQEIESLRQNKKESHKKFEELWAKEQQKKEITVTSNAQTAV